MSVSYTHLDVYKRQKLDRVDEAGNLYFDGSNFPWKLADDFAEDKRWGYPKWKVVLGKLTGKEMCIRDSVGADDAADLAHQRFAHVQIFTEVVLDGLHFPQAGRITGNSGKVRALSLIHISGAPDRKGPDREGL